ncbi:O-antigen ligase [Microbacterium sp.]|uniref:O-antigen ligase family protein n=1 Tax=Microbacterium sp. TaxID=51671 RepID=UPI00092C919D|nr:O-antigen ligase family protein [Microbacterium sp.]MBN9186214.1 O-antigen ligase family protein [Microbacterium sp.]MBN9192798.1 O-antigen ligase family protein [Microbacterium sp.]OJU68088.1 MAG: ligase [Microbacterium sp. 70-38]
MAVFSKHPVSPPPAAPVREKTGHLMLRGWCIFVLFLALSGVAWVNAIGTVAACALLGASALVSVALWIVLRPPVQWRRLPWFPLAYALWAGLSLLWSQWPGASALTWLMLLITTTQGLFVAAALTWHELVRGIASALKWCLGLSLVFELWVSVVVRGPILPEFQRPTHSVNPIVYWSRDNLFDGGRIQGIWGNANLLAAVCLVAIIVFAIRIAARAPRRTLLWVWMALAAFLLYRADSATVYVSAVMAAVVLATVLLMRTARTPGARTLLYSLYAVIGLGGALAVWLLRDIVFALLGRSANLTGRQSIWAHVLERAVQRPVAGWGFATPWIATDSHFDGWITDHGQTVMQAHNVWIDVFLQLGAVGVVLLALTYLAFLWRSWFFAVDRPRWDLRADRPYSALTLLPTLVGTVLIVQGVSESEPLLLWGWMFVVMLGFKIKQAPLVGVGPAEQSLAIERGELNPERAP